MTKPVCPACGKRDYGATLPADHGGRFHFTRCGHCRHPYSYNANGEVAHGHVEQVPSKDLLPCPFCSSTSLRLFDTGVQCVACMAAGPYVKSQDPRDSWNKRAATPERPRLIPGSPLDEYIDAVAERRAAQSSAHEPPATSKALLSWVRGQFERCVLASKTEEPADGDEAFNNATRFRELLAILERETPEPTPAPVAWRKSVGPQYDYSDRYQYREDHGIGAPEGWEPLYAAPPRAAQPPEAWRSALLDKPTEADGPVVLAFTGEAYSVEYPDDVNGVEHVAWCRITPYTRPTKEGGQ